MTANELLAAIEAALQDGNFSLDASSLGSDKLTALLAPYFSNSQLNLSSAQIATGNNETTVTGQVSGTVLGAENAHASARFYVQDTVVQLELVLSDLGEGWGMGAAFPELAENMIASLSYTSPSFTLSTQPDNALPLNFQTDLGYDASADLTAADLQQGLSFDSDLDLESLPTALHWAFGGLSGSETLHMQGPIETHGADRVVYLQLSSPVGIKLLKIDVQAQFSLVKVPASGETNDTSARISTTLPLDGGNVSLSASVPSFDSTSIMFESLPVDGQAASLSSFFSWMPNAGVSALFPSNFPGLDQVLLQQFSVQYNTTEKQADNIDVKMTMPDTWSFFDGAFTASDLNADIAIANPFDSAQRTTDISVTGRVSFGNLVLDGSFKFPANVFSLTMPQDEALDIKETLSSVIGNVPGMPAMQMSHLLLNGDITNKTYSFDAGITSAWTLDLGISTLAIQSIQLKIDYAAGPPKSVTAQITGTMAIGSTQFVVAADYTANAWLISGGIAEGSSVNLTTVASDLGKVFGVNLPGSVPDTKLTTLNLDYNTGTKEFNFEGVVEGTLPVNLANKRYDLSTSVILNSKLDDTGQNREFTGTAAATLDVGKSSLILSYDLDVASKIITAKWKADEGEGLTIDDMLSAIGVDNPVDIPDEMDIELQEVALEYNATKSMFVLSATTQFGTAFIAADRSTGKWGFTAGFVMIPEGGDLTTLPGIGGSFEGADFLDVDIAGIMISSVDISNWSLPELPSLDFGDDDDSSSSAGGFLDGLSLSLSKGLSLLSSVDLELQNNSKDLIGKVLDIIPTPKVVFQVSYSGSNISFYAGLPGTINIPNKNDSILSVGNAALKFTRNNVTQEFAFAVSGTFGFEVFGEELTVTISAIIENDGMAIAASIEADEDGLPGPPGLKGLHLYQLGLLMGVDFQPPGVTLALQGKFQIGVGKATLNEFGMALQIIEKIPTPKYFSFYLEEVGLDELITLVTDKPAAGVLKSLNNVQGYDVSFYWASDTMMLPDGSVTTPGLGFSGLLKFFGFGAYGNFTMSTDGIAGEAQIAPINLKNVIKITGNGEGIKRVYEKVDDNWQLVSNVSANTDMGVGEYKEQTIVKPGGAVLKFDAFGDPLLYMNWNITLFDLVSQRVEALFSTDSLSFSLTYKVGSALTLAIQCEFSDWSNFSASADFNLDLDFTVPGFKVAGVSMGDLKIDAELEASIDITVSSRKFELKIDGDFDFQGMNLDMPQVKLTAAPDNLKNIPGWIEDAIKDGAEDIFKDIFNTADKMADAIANGVVDAAEDTAKAFKDAYNTTAQKTAELMKDISGDAEEALKAVDAAFDSTADELADIGENIGMAADEVGDFLKDAKGLSDEAVSKALQGAGYAVDEVWDFMKNAYNWFQHVDVKHVDQGTVNWHADASKRFHVDNRKHFDLKFAGKKVHFDEGKTLGVDKRLTLTPHIDVPHVDLEPSPSKPHIDQKGVSIAKHKYGGQSFSSPHFDVNAGFRVKFGPYKKHFDLAHVDGRVNASVPKLPTSHIDVGHVDVSSKL